MRWEWGVVIRKEKNCQAYTTGVLLRRRRAGLLVASVSVMKRITRNSKLFTHLSRGSANAVGVALEEQEVRRPREHTRCKDSAVFRARHCGSAQGARSAEDLHAEERNAKRI